jgi:hypothetical protein
MIATHQVHRVELAAPLADVRFPNLCVACGATSPVGDVALEKMFRRTHGDAPTTYVYERVQVPLCVACLSSHQRAERPIDPAMIRRLRWTWLVRILPYVLPMGIILWLLAQLGPKTAASVAGLLATPRDWGGLIGVGILLFFLLCFYGFVRASLDAGRPLVASGPWDDPNATYMRTRPGALGSWYVIPGPPTPTLAAVNFADENFQIFGPNRRSFAFAHPEVARRFAEVNAELVWDSNSPRAQRVARRDKALIVAVVVAAVGVTLVQLVRG